MKTSMKKTLNFPVLIEKDSSGFFVGVVPSLRSCYTQAKTLPELYKRLQEVVSLSLEVERKLFKTDIRANQFIGVQNMEFAS
jgi:predicted RNase H-like HicB family nuclease